MKKNIYKRSYYRYITYITICFVSFCIAEKVVAQQHGTSLVEILKKVKPAIIAVGIYHPLSKPPVKYFGTGFVK